MVWEKRYRERDAEKEVWVVYAKTSDKMQNGAFTITPEKQKDSSQNISNCKC